MDVKCAVCGEPYDAYGIRHGDMLRWEARLFLQGAGCPSCQGVKPEGMTDAAVLAVLEDRLLINPDEAGDHDLMNRLLTGSELPQWRPPKPTALWTCFGCGVSVVRDPDTDYPDGPIDGVEGGDLMWVEGGGVHYYRGHAYRWADHPDAEDPSTRPAFVLDGHDYCPGCAQLCDACREVVIFKRAELEAGDSYASGSAFCHPTNMRSSVCVDCYEDLSLDADEE